MKLPVCPHCSTIYRYSDVRKTVGKKSCICYHCKREFKVSKGKIFILFLLIALFCAIFGVLELYCVPTLSFVAAVVSNIIIILIGLLLVPYFIMYRKPDSDENLNKGSEHSIDSKNYNKKSNSNKIK